MFLAPALLLLLFSKTGFGCIATKNTPGPVAPTKCNQCGDNIRKHETPEDGVPRKAIERDERRQGADGCNRRVIGCDGVPNAQDLFLQWNLMEAGTTRVEGQFDRVDQELECDAQGRWTILREKEKIPITDVECMSV
ncbi:hypothetical protein QR680_017089 [Steinernema hermaphroditum]|uniref:C6 domain-containing protein n=1 Tax=Steinernema hermaphroditum TaxID=289476 RepID=A0AA39HFP3_9BILA|nr:hypothetical protein QR680_017089 [Steinernema hermaphroditum]